MQQAGSEYPILCCSDGSMTQVFFFFFFSVFESQLTRPILRDVSGSDRSPSSQLETQLKLIKTTSAVQFNCHSIIGSGWESKRDSFSFPPKTTMAGWRNGADYPWPMLKLSWEERRTSAESSRTQGGRCWGHKLRYLHGFFYGSNECLYWLTFFFFFSFLLFLTLRLHNHEN